MAFSHEHKCAIHFDGKEDGELKEFTEGTLAKVRDVRSQWLRWLPMVLFSYNRIYRDQTLSARITRGMFVASYNKIFHSHRS